MKKIMIGIAAFTVVAVVAWGLVWMMDQRQVAQHASTAKPSVKITSTQPLRVGVFPRRSYSATKKAFTPFVEHLSRELGVEVKLVLFKDFKNFW